MTVTNAATVSDGNSEEGAYYYSDNGIGVRPAVVPLESSAAEKVVVSVSNRKEKRFEVCVVSRKLPVCPAFGMATFQTQHC